MIMKKSNLNLIPYKIGQRNEQAFHERGYACGQIIIWKMFDFINN